ncbi:MAG: signal recognition particle protein [Eubacteriales bacterium]|nr:signal recognition particle protein [Eubacteriales bacterium]
MAFEGLSQKLQNIFKKLTGRGKLSENDIKEAMREVRIALLEADVNYTIVKDFIKKVTERAIGAEILQSLTPGQQVIKIVNEELTALMGSTQSKLTVSPKPPTIILLCGLQGAGKTTMAAKLAGYLQKQGKKPLLVGCDIYRPAAIDQLKVLASQLQVPVFERGTADPVETAYLSVDYAIHKLADTVIVDTAGRLHIDEQMMQEIVAIRDKIKPTEILLTIDAMTGQDAVNVAKAFNDSIGIDGVIVTKLDGDTRGGAALSVKAVTGKPIKFAGTGEKLSDIEPFHPDRMASRILGMGDVLTLIEKAQSEFDEKSAAELEKKLQSNRFDLNDFLDQFKQIRKMGGIGSIMGMMGVDKSKMTSEEDAEKQMKRTEAIIQSMTMKERHNPQILDGSRRKRIAAGSGTTVTDVNRLINQFEQSKKMMKMFRNKKKGFKMPF